MKKHTPSKSRDDQPTLPLDPPDAAVASSLQPIVTETPSSPPADRTVRPARRATAEEMAGRQREISVSEFFTKNRHLLGFDNPAKALLTTIKEAVDNSLDACEEAGILPDILVECVEISEGRFRVAVQDNGPGIVKQQVPKIFGKLLYGSKFHRLKQSRGQQGIGISAAGLYAQLTTGKPIVILSKTGKGRPARRFELRIDTRRNAPEVLLDQETEWDVDHGTRVELELSGTYRGGRTSIDAYLEQTVVANPHLTLSYILPRTTEPIVFERAAHELPREPIEIKPHPHGVELGFLIGMMHESKGSTVKKTLTDSFSRVSSSVAEQVCASAGISPNDKSSRMTGDQIEALHKALGEVKVLAPPASCVVPIGEQLIEAGLKRRFPKADFFTSVTRPPSVYRGNPFVIECAIAYGGNLPADEQADVMRFANRVPLQYQPKACAMSEAIYETNWKAYELQQPRGSLPIGPLAVLIHLASVWVPFTSEAKEAVAHYPELLREMRLALQECGRKLGTHLRARSRAESALRRRSIFERYIPEIGVAIQKINGVDADKIAQVFLDALPAFVGAIEAEEGGGEEPPPAAPSTPSMPPPADVIAEEPPENGKALKAPPALKPIEPVSEPPPAKPVAKPAPEPKPAARPAPEPKPAPKQRAAAKPSPAPKELPPAKPEPSRKAKQPQPPPAAPKKHGPKRNGRQLELVR
ncbi:MAG: DNA topoisomerase VI subunit B [Deltaproteobacteria bacterium]|nr:DNA topoisomerase VI subunit B [Deltaproteobacteria bacterium]